MKKVFALFVLLFTAAALGQSGGGFDLTWSTVDGGGAMNSTGGAFSVSGTIGQPDAQAPPVMSGGSFQLTSGFWAVSISCFCPGDVNGDGKRNGADVQLFVACLLASSGYCVCADANQTGGLTPDDVPTFVSQLLTTTACP